ncbi:MAG: hypothetical protein E6713_17565 [Sporomusaceae bacterium]|nr:hypothetical protein [Sporomusaceae bacterium]
MDIHFQVPDIGKFNQAADKAPNVLLKNMRLAMNISCRDVQSEARAVHMFRSRTGNLERAVDFNVNDKGDNGVEGKVLIDENVAPYGKFVHPGTGIYAGRSAWQVRPRQKKSLRWVGSDGRFRFSKGNTIRGQRPDPFLYKSAEKNRQHVNDVFSSYTNRAIKEAGL